MARRTGTQEYPTVGDLVAQTIGVAGVDNQKGDTVAVDSTNRLYRWDVGNASAHNGTTVIEQTADGSGRWIAITASADVLASTVTIPVSQDNTGDTIAVSVPGLPAGSAVAVSVTNATTCYGGAALPNGFVLNVASVAGDGVVYVNYENNTGAAALAFTVNLSVVYQ